MLREGPFLDKNNDVFHDQGQGGLAKKCISLSMLLTRENIFFSLYGFFFWLGKLLPHFKAFSGKLNDVQTCAKCVQQQTAFTSYSIYFKGL